MSRSDFKALLTAGPLPVAFQGSVFGAAARLEQVPAHEVPVPAAQQAHEVRLSLRAASLVATVVLL